MLFVTDIDNFDDTLLDSFRNGNFNQAPQTVKDAWILFVGRFMVAGNSVWAEKYRQFPKDFEKYNFVTEEAFVLQLLKIYVPRWREGIQDDNLHHEEQEEEDNRHQQGQPIESKQQQGGKPKKKIVRVRANLRATQKIQLYKGLYESIAEARKDDNTGKTWNLAFGNWYKDKTMPDDEKARILGISMAPSSGSKRKRKTDQDACHIIVPVELLSDEEDDSEDEE